MSIPSLPTTLTCCPIASAPSHTFSSCQSYDVDNKWGSLALARVYQDMMGLEKEPMPGVHIPVGKVQI